MLWCYYLGQVWPFWGVIIWAKFAFYKTLFVKNTIRLGVSALLFWKKLRAQIWGVIIWAKLAILSCNQLGPDNNTCLARIITPQNDFFIVFVLRLIKMCWNTYVHSVFWTSTEIIQTGQKMGKKNDNFSHFAKHRFIKTPFCCNPLLNKNWCFSTLMFSTKKIDVEQKA